MPHNPRYYLASRRRCATQYAKRSTTTTGRATPSGAVGTAGRICSVPPGVVVPQWRPPRNPSATRQLQSVRPPGAVVCTIEWFDPGGPHGAFVVIAICEVRAKEVEL